MDYGLLQTVAPTTEPVTLSEVKAHLNLPLADSTFDTLLTRQIKAAREYVEQRSGRALITQTWRLAVRRFPGSDDIGGCAYEGALLLPRSPLQTVSSVKYLAAADGTDTTWAADQYVVSADMQPGRIEPAHGVSWPAVRERNQSVRVTYVAGYGAAAAVPARAVQAVLLMVGHMFLYREPTVTAAAAATMPYSLDAMIVGLRDGWVW